MHCVPISNIHVDRYKNLKVDILVKDGLASLTTSQVVDHRHIAAKHIPHSRYLIHKWVCVWRKLILIIN